MPDTKTTGETLRSPIDGTELVRLATTGANWKAPLSSIFTALSVRKLAPQNNYLDPAGSDITGDGSAGNPWKTLQHAYDTLATYDMGGQNVFVYYNDGTYNDNFQGFQPLTGGGILWIVGLNGSANVTVSGSISFLSPPFSKVRISGITFTQPAGSFCVSVNNTAVVDIWTDVVFGDTAFGSHLVATSFGVFNLLQDYSLTGNTLFHLLAESGGLIFFQLSNVTCIATPSLGWFATSIEGSLIHARFLNFIGSATGTRFKVDSGGIIDTAGGGANYFPGNAPGTGGTTTGGGFYV